MPQMQWLLVLLLLLSSLLQHPLPKIFLSPRGAHMHRKILVSGQMTPLMCNPHLHCGQIWVLFTQSENNGGGSTGQGGDSSSNVITLPSTAQSFLVVPRKQQFAGHSKEFSLTFPTEQDVPKQSSVVPEWKEHMLTLSFTYTRYLSPGYKLTMGPTLEQLSLILLPLWELHLFPSFILYFILFLQLPCFASKRISYQHSITRSTLN